MTKLLGEMIFKSHWLQTQALYLAKLPHTQRFTSQYRRVQ